MASPRPRTGPSIVLMIVYLVFAVVGLVALYGLIQTGGNSISIVEILYVAVATLALGFVAFSLMRVRKNYAMMNPPPNKVFDIVKCPSCSFKQIKNFSIGDYVPKTLGLCTQCNAANLYIDGIYGEGSGRK